MKLQMFINFLIREITVFDDRSTSISKPLTDGS